MSSVKQRISQSGYEEGGGEKGRRISSGTGDMGWASGA